MEAQLGQAACQKPAILRDRKFVSGTDPTRDTIPDIVVSERDRSRL
jgi:hypothetical protein